MLRSVMKLILISGLKSIVKISDEVNINIRVDVTVKISDEVNINIRVDQ